MWLPLPTFAVLCVLMDVYESTQVDNELELIFKQRSHSDWREAWHREKYVRCRETLIKHLFWACENDIYRISRRRPEKRFNNIFDEDAKYPWIPEKRAKLFIRSRRGINRRTGSITSECCKSSGCTWEEYAEYCPTNKRYTSYV
ncbi:probable insulin-like peptide 7 isoform X1 [Coccinella septempunctata]|uniref:probable insulin-like peptide 7 isoform X1 n=1 Tax=Coccinella septempunctata TaxID=41139 RepID=UPI001D07E09C|nr:probable insulin-like peptide 7 isoform X1 [Coccinella septempunctata]